MADDKNQEPEESFKDKILRAMHEQDDSMFKENRKEEHQQDSSNISRSYDSINQSETENSEFSNGSRNRQFDDPFEFQGRNDSNHQHNNFPDSTYDHEADSTTRGTDDNQHQRQTFSSYTDQYSQYSDERNHPYPGNDSQDTNNDSSYLGNQEASHLHTESSDFLNQGNSHQENFGDHPLNGRTDPFSNANMGDQFLDFPVSQQEESLNNSGQSSIGSRLEQNQGMTPDNTEPLEIGEENLSPKERKRRIRKKEDKLVNKIVLIVISALILIGTILGFSLYNYVQASLKPLDSDDTQFVQVEIPSGSSNKEIGEILEKGKVIKSGMIFNYYTKFNNLTDFQSGYYQMAPNMTLDEISHLLQAGGTAEPVDIADAKITIPEGFDVSQIAEEIEKSTEGKLKTDDFKALLLNEEFFQRMLAAYPQLLSSANEAQGVRYRLEGYLFPATYDYYAKSTTVESLAEQMIAKADSVLINYYEQIQNEGYTVQQVLTLASLVEKEGVTDSDRKNIAQVFLNRIATDMPLQSDISILYALDTHKELVTYEDLEVDSPYNLYKNTGYGPGPFANPSEEAIKAVLNPTPNDYYYFVADISTGKVYFAETYEEHEELVEKYVNN